MEPEENTKAYKLTQDDKDYIATLGIIQTFLHVTCQENIGINDKFYEANFSLEELTKISRFFKLTISIFEAQIELEKAIEKQQIGLEISGDLLNLIFYMTIGTDKIFLKLPLKKSDNIYKKFRNAEEQVILKGQLNLKNRGGNYPFDEQRINTIDSIKNDLVISQEGLICDIRRLLSVTDKLLKDTNFLSEENAKLQVRLKKIRLENEERSEEIKNLLSEEKLLKNDNNNLNNDIKILENKLNEKQEILNKTLHESKAKSLLPNDLYFGKGPKAVSSRFDDTQVRTFVPRPTNKPEIISYDTYRTTLKQDIDNNKNYNKTYNYMKQNDNLIKIKEPKTPKIYNKFEFGDFMKNDQLPNEIKTNVKIQNLSPVIQPIKQFGKTMDNPKMPPSLKNIAFNNERIETIEIYSKGQENNNLNNNTYNTYNNAYNPNYNINNYPEFQGGPGDSEKKMSATYDNNNININNNNIDKNQRNFIYNELLAPNRISEKTNDYEEEIPKTVSNIDIQNINSSNNNENTPFEKIGKEALKAKIDSEVEVEVTEKNINMINSEIITNSAEEDMLLNKIERNGKKLQFNLLYKATIDSDQASIFHKKCDKAKNTLVLVETIEGKRFGGFTTESWEGDCIEKNDKDAFIFSLDKLQIYSNIPGQKAIGCYPKFGPVFMGCQIKINDNFFVKGGTTFRKNANFATNNDYELTGGLKFFSVKDIEVFEVCLI